MIQKESYCYNCDKKTKFIIRMNLTTEKFNAYSLLECIECTAIVAFHKRSTNTKSPTTDYSEYNHLSKFSSEELIARSNRVSFSKRRVLNELESQYSKEMTILDFGGGSGVFVKSCHNLGYKNTYLFEPFEALRKVAINQLNIPSNRVIESLDSHHNKFDVITMFDVIEHLPSDEIRDIFSKLNSLMNSSASLIGTTPNINSVNIALHGENDPVIAPPSHTIYFSKKVLNNFIKSLGFKKHKIFTIGLSHNSFFRSNKFSHSWVERPSIKQKIPAKIIRTIFKVIGYLLIPTSRGYHIFFGIRNNKTC